ncbi:MAG: H/ACA RNA-protein complex protein Gar1 [Thermoplasmata archaeon]
MSRGDGRSASREVGTVLAVTPTGTLTVRAGGADAAEEGTIVTDRRGPFRGRVIRVFGPVARPYLVVRPRRAVSLQEGVALIGATLLRESRAEVEPR